jgi:hypothetical protein
VPQRRATSVGRNGLSASGRAAQPSI